MGGFPPPAVVRGVFQVHRSDQCRSKFQYSVSTVRYSQKICRSCQANDRLVWRSRAQNAFMAPFRNNVPMFKRVYWSDIF